MDSHLDVLRRRRQQPPSGGCDGNGDDRDVCGSCGRDLRHCRRRASATRWPGWQASNPPADTNDNSGDEVERIVRQLRATHEATVRLRSQFDKAATFTGSEEEDDEDEDDEDDSYEAQLSVGADNQNQSACDHSSSDGGGGGRSRLYDDPEPARSESVSLSPSLEQQTWWPSRQGPAGGGGWDGEGCHEQEVEDPEPQQRQRQQQLTTCEEDVIGQRLNSCLRLLQGGPYQECDLCVKTLSSCDQSQLTARELLGRLSNLESMLLYLQVHFRSDLSCSRLKLLGRLKRAISCMQGSLLRRQSEQLTAQVGGLHERLDRTGDFRKHWRPVPPGGEKFRFVADPLDCVPRVLPGDEWLRGFLPSGERASLGHILADTDPTVGERLGKRMAFTKRRGRSTRLHNLFTRDTYEDMLRRFQFALMR